MRIIFDLQTLYTNEKYRGIGVFTYNWIQTIIKTDKVNRYYGYRWNYKNSKWEFALLTPDRSLNDILQNDFLWSEEDFNIFMKLNKIDVINLPSPLMPDIIYPDDIDKNVLKTCMVYDLIPLIMKDVYYNKWSKKQKSDYDFKISKIKKIDKIFTDSSCSKNDIVNILGINEDRIEVIYASIKEELFKHDMGSKSDLNKFSIKNDYIFTLTGNDPRKNNKGIIEAFSLVSKRNQNIDLVIAGIKGEKEQQSLKEYADKFEVFDKVKILGYVTDEELVNLYNKAQVFVFISLYEGFGLPVLEAMKCGAPVIVSNTSSLPEVVGEAGIIIDLKNENDLAESILKVVENEELREKLSTLSLKQADKFSWDFVAAKTFNHLKLSYNSVKMINGKPELAFLSPLNPQKSGISDYCEQLLPYLNKYFDISLFVDNFIPSNQYINENFKVYNLKTDINKLENFKYRLYHMGNNELHLELYNTLKQYPGTVVLHDYNLYGLMTYSLFGKGLKKEYADEFLYSYGESGKNVINDLLNKGIYPNFIEFPLNRKLLDYSNSVIVHSDWVKSQIKKNGFCGKIQKINLAANAYQISDNEIEQYKLDLKLDNYDVTLGVFGNVIPNKRIDVILNSFYRLLETNPNAILCIVGIVDNNYYKVIKQKINEYGIEKNVRVTNSVELNILDEYMKSCDICINLRWPTVGETSISLVKALGFGKPCIVSNVNQYTEYSDDFCWKVDVDEYEEELLLAYLIELCNNKSLRKEMGKKAYEYINKEYNFELIAKQYFQFIAE